MTTPYANPSHETSGALPMTETPRPPADPPAWRNGRSIVLLLAIAALGLATDLLTKHLAFTRLPVTGRTGDRIVLIPHVLSFDRSLNLGALFGIGKGMTWVFILASLAAVLFVAYMFATSRRRQWVTHVALALVLAGALGNLYDRLFVRVDVVWRADGSYYSGIVTAESDNYVHLGSYPDPAKGYVQKIHRGRNPSASPVRVDYGRSAVRDFIRFDISIKGFELWPWIFNIADAMLVVGVSLLLIIYWRHPVAPAPAATDQ